MFGNPFLPLLNPFQPCLKFVLSSRLPFGHMKGVGFTLLLSGFSALLPFLGSAGALLFDHRVKRCDTFIQSGPQLFDNRSRCG